MPSAPLYWHPTTVVVVDDDPVFLESFAFRYEGRFRSRAFQQPEAALDHILKAAEALPREADYFDVHVDVNDLASRTAEDPVFALRRARIAERARDADRFAEVSVLVVDYDMPGMDGLELCRRLQDAPLR